MKEKGTLCEVFEYMRYTGDDKQLMQTYEQFWIANALREPGTRWLDMYTNWQRGGYYYRVILKNEKLNPETNKKRDGREICESSFVKCSR